ncbi:hypothetical protein BAY61_24935 [Prauserella marina]|uniref:Uncharacterized protein n=1 Tax=Prauserella marina TaxID=530584 RepID=A0A222VUY5_9PSEU|nr:hypothetical protein [Prauserella marina]ASR37710.1 hypothetical protein BAY61_24935 [Prauserella marina]PWV75645.1 hypothetical protein DES30_106262 [Prauserella marina]SDD29776.1 hypothetical protein SAMN05421630_107178 [Prauserella marina]
MSYDFAGAREFLGTHARPLERRLAELWFDGVGGAVDAVLSTLSGYRNADGGLGYALEPDVRDPGSQPVAVDFALGVVEWILDAPSTESRAAAKVTEFASGLVPYLRSVSVDGGLPIVLPSLAAHPHAAHWGDGRFPPSLNPTAGIVARLRKAGVDDPWLDEADSFCREKIETLDGKLDGHTALNVLCFLSESSSPWARQQLTAFADTVADWSLFHLYPGEGYGVTPLEVAPAPGPLRALFPSDAIEAHLAELEAEQQDDGGWPLSWAPPGPMAELEWRGWRTLQAIRTLSAR